MGRTTFECKPASFFCQDCLPAFFGPLTGKILCLLGDSVSRKENRLFTCCRTCLFYHRVMEVVITLLVVGAVLLLLETVLPGMVAGVLGLLCLIAGVVQAYITFGPRMGSY